MARFEADEVHQPELTRLLPRHEVKEAAHGDVARIEQEGRPLATQLLHEGGKARYAAQGLVVAHSLRGVVPVGHSQQSGLPVVGVQQGDGIGGVGETEEQGQRHRSTLSVCPGEGGDFLPDPSEQDCAYKEAESGTQHAHADDGAGGADGGRFHPLLPPSLGIAVDIAQPVLLLFVREPFGTRV